MKNPTPLTPANVAPGRLLKFRMLKEGWSRYRVTDFPIEVWSRQIATKIVEIVPTAGQPKPDVPIGVLTLPINITFAEPPLLGPPQTRPYTEEDLGRARRRVLRYRALEEPSNVYLLEGFGGTPQQILETKCVVLKIELLEGIRGTTGEPGVHVTAQNIISVPREAGLDEIGG